MRELFMRYPDFKTKAFTMSFDDGRDFDREMVEILDKYGLKCTFNLNTNSIDKVGFITSKEALQLYKNHEVAVHTYHHPHLDNLDNAGILSEVLDDRKGLEKLFGKIIKGMAYPFCLNSERVLSCVRMCGIDYARTVESTHDFSLPKDFLIWNPTCHHRDEMLDSLLEEFLLPDDTEHPWRITTKLFYLWGHSYEFENCFEKLEIIAQKFSNKDTVWYATNGEIFKYIQSYKRLVFSADGSMVYNPTDTDIFVFCNNKNILIPSTENCIIK